MRIESSLNSLFSLTERYSDRKFAFKSEVHEKFSAVSHELIDLHAILSSLLQGLDFKEESESSSPYFEQLKCVSSFIEDIYRFDSDKILIRESLFRSAEESGRKIVLSACRLNDFLSILLSALNIHKILINRLFDSIEFRESHLKGLYIGIIESTDFPFSRLSESISISCLARETVVPFYAYSLLFFFEPSQKIADYFVQSLVSPLHKEKRDIPELGSTIDFYMSMIETKMSANPSVLLPFTSEAMKFVNSDKSLILRSLVIYSSKQAKSSGDASQCASVFRLLGYKVEFELLYTRAVSRKLATITSDQISRENALISSIKASSHLYEFRTLLEILQNALKSFEIHIGPIIYVPLHLWPFRHPLPKPIQLSSFSEVVAKKYTEMFKNRILTFPIDFWTVSVKYREKDVVLSGNGVQAEVALLFNSRDTIDHLSLLPEIDEKQCSAALKTLAELKPPFLVADGGVFKINPNFRPVAKIIKLKQPQLEKDSEAEVQYSQQKETAIDASLVKALKAKRSLSLDEMETAARNDLAGRYIIESSDVKKRIFAITDRGFCQRSAEGLFQYLA